jgi:rhamnogalacturonan endolyase
MKHWSRFAVLSSSVENILMNRISQYSWPLLISAIVLLLMACAGPAQAAPVTVRQNASNIILNNGLIQLTFSKPHARISSIIDEMGGRHLELLNTSIGMYFDANGGRLRKPRHLAGAPKRRSYFVPLTGRGCRVIRNGDESAEVIFKAAPSFWFPFAIQAHFELRAGQSGFYAWVIYHHAAGTPGGAIAQTRFVIKAADGHSVFTHWAVDKYAVQSPLMGVLPEQRIIQKIQDVTYLLSNHQIWCKYDYCLFNYQFLCYGMAGHDTGLWMTWPSTGFFNGGPLRQELTVHQQHVGDRLAKNNILAMIDGAHFGEVSVRVPRADNWTKFFGPIFVYVNNGPSLMGLYHQARAVARQQRAEAPFHWLHSADYPLARGRIEGVVRMTNDHNPAGAWAIISGNGNADWALQGRGYNYWTKVKPGGRFVIGKIRPGLYKLSICGGNQFQDYVQHNIRVGPDRTTNLGTIRWTPANRGKTLWEIGVANRSAREFFDGNNVRHYRNFVRYLKNFPDDVTYTIGKSTPAKDWNFAQWGWYSKKPYWTIKFNLPRQQHGKATLTLGFCAALMSRGGLAITLNGRRITVLHLPKSGAAVYRSGGQDSKYQVRYITFNADLLKAGLNRMTLGFTRAFKAPGTYAQQMRYHPTPVGAVIYDAIRLQVQH